MLKWYLEKNEISMYNLSKKSGVSYATLNELANNVTNIDKCTIKTGRLLAKALNITIEELYNICTFKNKSLEEIMDVYSENYNIKGTLFLSENNHYLISLEHNGRTYQRKLYHRKYMDNEFLPDYAWMSLEDLYEDIMLELE